VTVFTGPAIQVPEHAGPIFNPLKGLADAIRVMGVSVAPLLRVEGGMRIGGQPNVRQFSFESQEHFPEVAAKIAELGKVVRFVEMFVPQSGVFCAQTHRFDNIWARYVAAYDCASDQSYGRWDVLVEPLSQ
jgi:hypothetical protein